MKPHDDVKPNDGQSSSTVGLGADGIAFEYEACMRAMDVAGVPRTDPTFGAIYSIWGRAQWMAANNQVERLPD